MKKIKEYSVIILSAFLLVVGFYYGKEYYDNKVYEDRVATILNDSSFNHLDFYNNIYSKNFEELVIEVVNLAYEEEKNKDIIEDITLHFELLTINKMGMDEFIFSDDITHEDKKFLILQNDLISLLMKKIELHKDSKK